MKKLVLLFLFCVSSLFNPLDTFSYSIETHVDVTKTAINSSIVMSYLQNHLGITPDNLFKGPAINRNNPIDSNDPTKENEIESIYTVVDWMIEGAGSEDEYLTLQMLRYTGLDIRANNHFYNPFWANTVIYPYGNGILAQKGGLYDETVDELSNLIMSKGLPSLNWAYNGNKDTGNAVTQYTRDPKNSWSWVKAREYYFSALTSNDPNIRENSFAKLFRSLGQVMHLIQDAAQPEHTRNDAHPFSSYTGYEDFVAHNYSTISSTPKLDYSQVINSTEPILDFFDSIPRGGFFNSTGSKGLAEFSSYNFLTGDTIKENRDSDYQFTGQLDKNSYFTHPILDENRTVIEKGFFNDVLYYYSEPIIDPAGQALALSIPLAKRTWHHNLLRSYGVYSAYTERDEKIWRSKADILLPKAVSYSASLLNYFFRGTLEITAPDQFVYSVADGSITPQQFTYIKAKIKNTTPNEEMQNGIIQAVARYKNRTDYQSDLSTDPPVATSREAEYSYFVSAPITITSLSSTTPEEFTFDFSSSPIPAGITDLYLHVIFKGTLGREIDTAIAVGMKDLNEPMHITIWNATDRFYLDGVLRTADEIRNNPQLLSRVDHNGDSISDEFIDPYDVTTRLAFTTTTDIPAVYNVIYAPLPHGRYGRVIILTDAPSFYIHVHRESTNSVDSLDSYALYSGVINQETNEIFTNTQIYTFRGITQHQWSAYSRYYPYSTGMSTAPWPAPQNPNPYPATAINP